MKKYKRYFELKEELKNLSKEIRIWKKNRKQAKRTELNLPLWSIQSKLRDLKYEIRHKHIIYCCYMQNTAYEKVEHKCHIPLNTYYINNLKKEWLDEFPEAVCSGS